jgi:hypothetical protein
MSLGLSEALILIVLGIFIVGGIIAARRAARR